MADSWGVHVSIEGLREKSEYKWIWDYNHIKCTIWFVLYWHTILAKEEGMGQIQYVSIM